MTIEETIRYESQKFGLHFLDCELILSDILRCSREKLISESDQPVKKNSLKKFRELLEKRKNGYPLAYIKGKKEFFGHDFLVNEECLIPRPETELLVEKVQEYIHSLPQKKGKLHLVDVGTGSGCIAISLAKAVARKSNFLKKITAVDISHKALEIALENISFHQLNDKIAVRKSDLLTSVKDQKIDIIVANLPYISEIEPLHSSVRFEPKEALLAGKDGLKFYRKLFRQIRKWEIYPQFLAFEIGFGQAEKIKTLVSRYFAFFDLKIYDDLAGIPRVVTVHSWRKS